MIERKFEAAEGAETIGLSHSDFGFVVQTLDNSAGKQLLSAKIVEDQFAVLGLYGLVAYSVSRRTREIGIRMALGAGRRSVVWMVLRQGLALSLGGVAVGLVAAFYACRAVTSAIELFTFKRVDPTIFIAIPLLLLMVTVLAAWAPAHRAARVDPLTSLRDE